jgi:cell division septum initiation protein DivIVA
MRSKTMTIMAAAVLFLPTIAHAQPSEGRGLYHRDDLKNARDDVRANRNVTDSSSTAAPLSRMTKPNDRATTKRADAHAQPVEGRGIYKRDDLKNARDDVRANSNPVLDIAAALDTGENTESGRNQRDEKLPARKIQ